MEVWLRDKPQVLRLRLAHKCAPIFAQDDSLFGTFAQDDSLLGTRMG
jgi:hypothetical protein